MSIRPARQSARSHCSPALRRLLMSSVAMLAALSLLGTPATASAMPQSPDEHAKKRDYYGAVYVASDGATGRAWDYSTIAGAKLAARRYCVNSSNYPGTCAYAGWVRNQCLAVNATFRSSGAIYRYHVGWGPTPALAKQWAHSGFGGRLLTWFCTTRPA